MIFKRRTRLLEVIEFKDFKSLPDKYKYSKSNPFGIMEFNIPIKCNRCGQKGNHGIFYKDGQEYLICPGLYISSKMDIFTKEDLYKEYEEVEIIDAETINDDEDHS